MKTGRHNNHPKRCQVARKEQRTGTRVSPALNRVLAELESNSASARAVIAQSRQAPTDYFLAVLEVMNQHVWTVCLKATTDEDVETARDWTDLLIKLRQSELNAAGLALRREHLYRHNTKPALDGTGRLRKTRLLGQGVFA